MPSSLRASLSRFRGFSRNAWLYLTSNTIQAFSAAAIGVVYTLFLQGAGFTLTFIGASLFLATAGGAAAILPASALVRRFGWRTMLLWSNYIGGVALFAQFIAPSPAVTLLTSLGVGASVAIFLVLNGPFLAACCRPDQRNAIFGLNNALGWLAAVTGALLGGWLPIWLRAADVAGAARASGPLVWLAPALTTARPLLLAGAQARSYQEAILLAGLVAIPSIIPIFMLGPMAAPEKPAGLVAESAPVSTLRARVEVWLPQARELVTGLIGKFSLSQMLVGLGAGLFFPFLNIYFVERLHATTAFYGALTSVVTAGLAVVSLVSAPLADRFGQMRLALVAQIVSLPFMVVMGAFPALWVVAIAYVMRTALINTGSAPEQAWLMDVIPPERRVVASNVYNASWQGAWAVGAAIAGPLISAAGYAAPFYLAAALYATSAFLMFRWLLPSRISTVASATVEPQTAADGAGWASGE
ncbi:MAG TPA: MFS transporter [Ktedonobacterales bacterium]